MQIIDKGSIFPNPATEQLGYLYIADLGDGSVKIGITQNPKNRYQSLKSMLEGYGDKEMRRFAISIAHANYKKNELSFKRNYASSLIGAKERFRITFQEALEFAKKLDFESAQTLIQSSATFKATGKYSGVNRLIAEMEEKRKAQEAWDNLETLDSQFHLWIDIYQAKTWSTKAKDRLAKFEMWLDTLDEDDLDFMNQLAEQRPSLFADVDGIAGTYAKPQDGK